MKDKTIDCRINVKEIINKYFPKETDVDNDDVLSPILFRRFILSKLKTNILLIAKHANSNQVN